MIDPHMQLGLTSDGRRWLLCPNCGGNVVRRGKSAEHQNELTVGFSCRRCGRASTLTIVREVTSVAELDRIMIDWR